MDRADLVYKSSAWQKALYDLQHDEQETLRKSAARGEVKNENYAAFQRELFGRLYNPSTPKLDNVADGAQWAAELHDLAEQVNEFSALQERCKGDELYASMGTVALSGSIVGAMQSGKQADSKEQDQLQNEIELLRNLQKRGANVDARLKKANARLAKAEAKAEAAAKGVDPAAMRVAIRSACEKMQQEINETDEQIEALSWGDQPGAPTSRKDPNRQALAKALAKSNKLREIAKLAGRLRRVAADKQRSKTNYAREEIASVEQGGELERLLPSEMMQLAGGDEMLEVACFARMLDRQCLQYELRGRETQGRGPIVVCLDESGSMQGPRETWSKAVALALLDVAQRQGRGWTLIHFSTTVTRVDTFAAGEIDQGRLLACLEAFAGGGTSYDEPMRKAVETIETSAAMRKADVLLVTDGACQTGAGFDGWLTEKKQQHDFSIFTVLVGTYATASVNKWSNDVYDLNDLIDNDADRFEQMVFGM